MSRQARLLCVLAAAVGLTALAASGTAAVLYSFGPPDATASDPPNYDNCTLCHVGSAVNAGSGEVRIDGVPAAYTPGATYTLTVSLSDGTASRWGFELVALDESGNGAGTITITDAARTQVSVSGNRSYVKHTSTGTDTGQTGGTSWSFDWTAPAMGTGTVFFYVSGNAANGNSSSNGDLIYNSATAAAEAGTAYADATLVMQPDSAFIARGGFWTVYTRVRNHLASSWTPVFVSNVTLPTGSVFPGPNQFLENPINHPLVAEGLATGSITHFIPSSAPIGTYTYNGFLGLLPNILIDTDSFSFTIF